MAEALGLAASVIAVVCLAGQVVQGCGTIKNLVGDVKSAPDDIQGLVRELEGIEESAKFAEAFGTKIDIDLQGQLKPALQLCFDAVEAIRMKIADAESVFKDKNKGSGRKSRGSMGWHRLKAAFEKKGVQEAVDKLSRAKMQLVVAQGNVSLNLGQNQQEKLKSIGKEVSTGLQASQSSASVLDRMEKRAQEIHEQVGTTATAVTSLTADMKRLAEDLGQSSTMPTIIPIMETIMERTMESVIKKHAVQIYQRNEGGGNASYLNISIAESETPDENLRAAPRGSRYLSQKEFLFRGPFITISKTTSTATAESRGVEEDIGVRMGVNVVRD